MDTHTHTHPPEPLQNAVLAEAMATRRLPGFPQHQHANRTFIASVRCRHKLIIIALHLAVEGEAAITSCRRFVGARDAHQCRWIHRRGFRHGAVNSAERQNEPWRPWRRQNESGADRVDCLVLCGCSFLASSVGAGPIQSQM